MRLRYGLAISLAPLAAALVCPAQDAPQQIIISPGMPQVKPTGPTGALTGFVYCADTNLPARLASVYLVQISERSFGTNRRVTTDLEGRFVMNQVLDGDYYVVATLPGYVNPMTSLMKLHLAGLPDDDRKSLLAALSSVTVSASQPAEVSIRLERGTEIDGTVIYDDGSPAVGLTLSYSLKAGPELKLPQMMHGQIISSSQEGPPTTDDRGRFRILGVSPGEYMVSVSLPQKSAARAAENPAAEMIESAFSSFGVYLGDTLRADKAETIKVTEGGASKDADITIPLSKLHTIRGQVVLKSTGQPPPSAYIQLRYADTKELAGIAVAPDGEFEFDHVPEDSFLLEAIANSTPLAEARTWSGGAVGRVLDPYSKASATEMPLTVTGDLDDITIDLSDPVPLQVTPPYGVEPADDSE